MTDNAKSMISIINKGYTNVKLNIILYTLKSGILTVKNYIEGDKSFLYVLSDMKIKITSCMIYFNHKIGNNHSSPHVLLKI